MTPPNKQNDTVNKPSQWVFGGAVVAVIALVIGLGVLVSPHPKPLEENTLEFIPPTATAPITLDMSEATILRGAKVFRLCRSCHTVEEGAPNRVGPNLYDLFDTPVASKAGYPYSKTLREAGASGMIWTPEHLYEWLKHPRDFLKGSKMTFIGLPDSADRLAVISYLKAFSTEAEITPDTPSLPAPPTP